MTKRAGNKIATPMVANRRRKREQCERERLRNSRAQSARVRARECVRARARYAAQCSEEKEPGAFIVQGQHTFRERGSLARTQLRLRTNSTLPPSRFRRFVDARFSSRFSRALNCRLSPFPVRTRTEPQLQVKDLWPFAKERLLVNARINLSF